MMDMLNVPFFILIVFTVEVFTNNFAITPMINSLSLMESAETENEVLGLGLSVIVLNLGMYLGLPAIIVVGIRKFTISG